MNIYLDTSLIIGWLKDIVRKKKHGADVIEFLTAHPEIKNHISFLTKLEIYSVTAHDEYFKSRNTQKEQIDAFLETLANTIQLNLIKEIKNIDISEELVKYVLLHDEIIDCMHVNIAKNTDLILVTNDKNICRLKPIYNKIIKFDELVEITRKK